MNLNEMISQIKPVNKEAYNVCKKRFDNVAKPIGSLGKLEELIERIAGITGSADIDISKKAVAVFCADNGVLKHGVAMHDHHVTTAIGKFLRDGRGNVSTMAEASGADVFAMDIGMVDTVDGLRNGKLMPGTNDMTQGPAMSRETAIEAIQTGIEMVKELSNKGYRLIATGEAGIGNTTTSAAVCAALLNRPVSDVTGRGSGLDDEGYARKIAAIEQAIAVNKPDSSDPIDVLHKVGGLDIAAMTGVFLGGAFYKIPIVMDGFISGISALLAVRLCANVRDYILPSHMSEEPGAQLLMQEMHFSPILQAGMRLGEGTGAVALFPLLDLALAVYQKTATYADI